MKHKKHLCDFVAIISMLFLFVFRGFPPSRFGMAGLELAGTPQPHQESQENQEHEDNIAPKTHNQKTHIRETVIFLVSHVYVFMFCFIEVLAFPFSRSVMAELWSWPRRSNQINNKKNQKTNVTFRKKQTQWNISTIVVNWVPTIFRTVSIGFLVFLDVVVFR